MRPVLFLLLLLFVSVHGDSIFGQVQPESVQKAFPDLILTATGTGRTTGHIANLTVKHTGVEPVHINEQTTYIPSGGQYQPYVAKIPSSMIPAGGTITIPVHGYCADVRTPPVPSDAMLPPLEKWVAIPGPTVDPSPGIKYVNLVENTIPAFSPGDIPGIIESPGFKLESNPPVTSFLPTWPGTDILVGGIIDPVKYPEMFGPVIIDALQQITKTYDQQKGKDQITTPFSGDPVKEREAVIQQTFWIFMADITGERYEKEHFSEKTIQQFESNSGKGIATLPADQKEKLEDGVDQFWNVFTAVGTEAKVLSSAQMQIFPKTDKDKTLGDDIEKAKRNKAAGQSGESTAPPPPNMAPPVNTGCLCDSLTYKLEVRRENPKDATRDSVFYKDATAQSLKKDNTLKKLPYKNWKQGDAYIISITDLNMHCHCQNITRENGDCDFYAANPISTEKGKVNLKKEPETKQGVAENTKDVQEKNTVKKALRKDSEFIYKFTPKANDKETGQVQITFCLSSVCSSNDCIITNNKVDCGPYCFTISFME